MRYTVNCSILLTDRPLDQRFLAVAEAGLDAVELWWPFGSPVPAPADVDALVAALETAQVRLTGLNFDAGDMPSGDRGLVSWPQHQERFRANVAAVVAIGERTGCRSFNALYGLRRPQWTPEEQDRVGRANLAFAAQAVAEIGGTVLLEPVSAAPGYPLLTARDAIEVIDQVEAQYGVDNIGLLLDVFHLASNGDNVGAAIDAYAARTAHVQIADAPGRGAPGTGELPIMAWLERLAKAGYDGWIGLEYRQAVDPFGWLEH
jgi:hydroxypyruvate isomerase